MHDRYSSCFSRANLRDACPGYWRDSQLWHVQSSNMQRETPKKICHDDESCLLCKRTFSVAKEKIRVFGKSSFDISSLIHRALNVDLTVYVDREQLAICRTQCYSRIDLFGLYILFSHFRPRDATRGNSFFQMSSYARANLRITNEKTKGKFP